MLLPPGGRTAVGALTGEEATGAGVGRARGSRGGECRVKSGQPHQHGGRDMPRYRFSWDNLPPELLHQLGSDLRLRPPVDQALRERYGARPEPDFVRDAWPTLIKAWLATDDESRELVVDELHA